MSRGAPYLNFPGWLPYHMTYLSMHLMLPTPQCWEQIDACENITFPQLRLRVIVIIGFKSFMSFGLANPV